MPPARGTELEPPAGELLEPKEAARPTELLTGPALGLAVYGFTTQVGLPNVVAAILAVAAAFGPLFVSLMVDALRHERRREQLPPLPPPRP